STSASSSTGRERGHRAELRMTALLALITVTTWGVWIPLAQIVPSISQHTRTFYVTVGNLAFATCALLIGGGHLDFGWRTFWLPLAGGVVWTAGNFSAFRATESIGLARAAGTWTPLNIIVAFIWGALLFGELDDFSTAHFAFLAAALMLILIGMLLIVGSQSTPAANTPDPPVQAAPDSPASDPALALSRRELTRLSLRMTSLQITAGVLFGIGNLALLGLIPRVGTGVGFTIAQLSLLVNASVGIWIFKRPQPGTRAARTALTGILIAGVGGCIIGAMR